MAELLLELLSEEIPARMQARAAEDLKRLVTAKLKEAGLSFDKAEAYVTPRRLALVVDGLPVKQPDITEEKKGPRVDAPDKAIQGFLRSVGLARNQVEARETPKGKVLFAVEHRTGRPTPDIVAEIIPEVIRKLPWPKSMRWGWGEPEAGALLNEDGSTLRIEGGGKLLLDLPPLRWVRPLHGILCLFDSAVVPFTFNGIDAGDSTVGHRFMAPGPIKAVTDLADYRDKLRAAYVILGAAERRARIAEQASELATAEGFTVKPDDGLVAENAGMVEWPVVLMGRIDREFMELPPEVLTTAMRHHQKYFALTDKDGRLAPRFLVVANIETSDKGKQIVAGNERVLRARLADAKFFWDHDRKQTLASRVEDLDGVVFHERLGTLGDKVKRIEALAVELAKSVPNADSNAARKAARLCKADLTTKMVGEFPALQGIMGRYYALNDGERPEIADAIALHYLPQAATDCPTFDVAATAVVISLSDKIDTLVGFFAIGEKPTGSKDPYALRRAALGVIRLILENKLRLPLKQEFQRAFMPYGLRFLHDHDFVQYVSRKHLSERELSDENIEHNWDQQLAISALHGEATDVAVGLLSFFADRLKVVLKESGVRHDLISAVFALTGEDDLVRLLARVEALGAFLASDDGEHLLTAYKRAANIVRIEEKRDGKPYNEAPVAGLIRQDEEKELHASLAAAAKASSDLLADEDFAGAMAELARLRGPVDRFFDEVTVNCEEPELRANRLRLLSEIRSTLDRVADFSQIEGVGGA